jgi:hypothetical protein
VQWRWWKKKTPGQTLKVRSRSDADRVSRIDLTDLVPPAADFLASVSATTLVLAGEYSRVGRQAWSVVDQDALARASSHMLTRYETLHALLADYVSDPTEALVQPLASIREHMARLSADRWFERVATCYVTSGFLMDFYRIMAGGLPPGLAKKISDVLDAGPAESLPAEVLVRVVELDEQYVSRLSLWSRRLVGDTMLIARDVLPPVTPSGSNTDRFEPLFTDVLAGHTARLDGLGLTA